MEWNTITDSGLRQDALLRRMNHWSQVHGYKIDETVRFDKTAMDAFGNLTFNPAGETKVRFANADRGMAPLLCMTMTEEDIAQSTAKDAARAATEGNQTIGEYLQLLTSDPRPPPRNYDQLCLMVATYAALNSRDPI